MDLVYYVTGFIVWVAIYGVLLWLAGEVVWGFTLTCSWVRWVMTRSRMHNEPLRWSKFPRSFLRVWGDLIGHRVGNLSFESTNGAWHGFGKWTVAAPQQIDKGG